MNSLYAVLLVFHEGLRDLLGLQYSALSPFSLLAFGASLLVAVLFMLPTALFGGGRVARLIGIAFAVFLGLLTVLWAPFSGL